MLTVGGLPLSLSAAVSSVGSGSPIMCGDIKKKSQCSNWRAEDTDTEPVNK